jgi:hypothetical protein
MRTLSRSAASAWIEPTWSPRWTGSARVFATCGEDAGRPIQPDP